MTSNGQTTLGADDSVVTNFITKSLQDFEQLLSDIRQMETPALTTDLPNIHREIATRFVTKLIGNLEMFPGIGQLSNRLNGGVDLSISQSQLSNGDEPLDLSSCLKGRIVRARSSPGMEPLLGSSPDGSQSENGSSTSAMIGGGDDGRDSIMGKNGRVRKMYTPYQKQVLDAEYELSAFVTSQRRAQLSKETGLSEKQIKIWYQNRRSKNKKFSNNNKAVEPMDAP